MMICRAAPEERPEPRIRFAEGETPVQICKKIANDLISVVDL
jgi:hypothetical protein